MANKISVLIDASVDKAVSAIGKFKTAMVDADKNGTSKFKAGATAALDTVKENAAGFAVAAGGALVAFGISAVHAFEDVAKAAINLAKATGLSTEEASRWIGVADDYQVSAEALAAGLGKIDKSLDDKKWAKYGIATHDAAGNARSANDILLDSLAALSEMGNATERAAAGQKLFGKGFAALAPLIGHTRAEYEKMLGAVEAGQVITASEAAKAERIRLAEDALSDALKEVALSAGQALAGLAPAVEKAAEFIGLIAKIADASGGKPVDELSQEFQDLKPSIKAAGLDLNQWIRDLHDGNKTLDELRAAIQKGGVDVRTFGQRVGDAALAQAKASTATNEATKVQDAQSQAVLDARAALIQQDRQLGYVADSENAVADAAKAQSDQQDRVNAATALGAERLAAYTAELDALAGKLDNEQAFLNLTQSIDDTTAAITDLKKQQADGSITAVESLRKQALALDDVKQKIIEYGKQIGATPGDIKVLVDLYDNGEIDEFNRRITELTKDRELRVKIVTEGADSVQHARAKGLGGAGFAAPVSASPGPKVTSSTGAGFGENAAVSVTKIEKVAKVAEETTKVVEKSAEDQAKAAEDARRSDERLWSLQYEFGRITRDQYEALLKGRVNDLTEFSDEWVDVQRQIRDLDKDTADEIAAAQKDADDTRKKAEKDAADALLQAQKDANKAAEDEAKAHADRIQAIFDKAAEHRDRSESERTASSAVDDLHAAQVKADLYGLDPHRTADERAGANADLEAAKDRAAQALYRRADARANDEGAEDGTEAWAAFVRAALAADIANAPGLATAIGRILEGIPQFATGGRVPGARGVPRLVLAHGGEQISREGQGSGGVTNVTINAGHDIRQTVAALRRYVKVNGPIKGIAS